MTALTPTEAELVEQLRDRRADYEDTQALIAVIDRLRTPAVVLEEAERLLRAQDVLAVELYATHVEVQLYADHPQDESIRDFRIKPTLAETYAALREGT